MGHIEVVDLWRNPRLEEEWDLIVKGSWRYDFYHLSSYHLLAQKMGEGKPVLLVYRDGIQTVALPILIRPVSEVTGLEGWDYKDATSVYGYTGPLSSHANIPEKISQGFKEAVFDYLISERIVSLFSRLHPLIPQQRTLIDGLGTVVEVGATVSINTRLPLETQWILYRKSLKRDIKRLKHHGFTCIRDKDTICLQDFIKIYYETMGRVNASRYYFFEPEYFYKFMQLAGVEVNLFICHLEGKIASGGLFTLCNGIVQYHLGASSESFLEYAPMKLLFDEVRLWSHQRGAWVFHLGGGVGGREELLFEFKAGFSSQRHKFEVWKWVLDPKSYQQLCETRSAWLWPNEGDMTGENFFPAYRNPVFLGDNRLP
jgi:hypothetical protein